MARIPLTARAADAGTLRDRPARIGYYAMLACTLNAFGVRPDPGEEELDVP